MVRIHFPPAVSPVRTRFSGSNPIYDVRAHLAEPAQSVLDRASPVLRLPWRALRHKVSRGVTAPLFSLDHWWEVLSLRRRACLTSEPRGWLMGRRQR
jgi:hypothetical protein